MSGPLVGIKVLDMSRVLAGPWAGQLLGDYGADVIKIERPSVGDDTRHWGPPWLGDESEAAYFLATNRNKRSVTVDIANSEGAAVIRDLAKHADVILENFRLGSMSLLAENPVGFSRTPVCYGLAPPTLGQHTNEVLGDWLGYSDEKIEALRAAGAV